MRQNLSSCRCQNAFNKEHPHYIKSDFYAHLTEHALRLKKNTITIMSVGCGQLEDEFEISEMLMSNAINVNWILIEPCLNAWSRKAFLALTKRQDNITCNIIEEHSYLQYYDFNRFLNVIKNSQKESPPKKKKPTLHNPLYLTSHSKFHSTPESVYNNPHLIETNDNKIEPDIIMGIDTPISNEDLLDDLTKIWLDAESKFFMLEKTIIKLPNQVEKSFDAWRFNKKNISPVAINTPSPLNDDHEKQIEKKSTAPTPHPAAQVFTYHANYAPIKAALEKWLESTKHAFSTELELIERVRKFCDTFDSELKKYTNNPQPDQLHKKDEWANLAIKKAEECFGIDHKVVRILADILITLSCAVGVGFIVIGVKKATTDHCFFFFGKHRESACVKSLYNEITLNVNSH